MAKAESKFEWKIEQCNNIPIKSSMTFPLNLDISGYEMILFSIDNYQGKGKIYLEDFNNELWYSEFNITGSDREYLHILSGFQPVSSNSKSCFDTADIHSVTFEFLDSKDNPAILKYLKLIGSRGIFGPTVSIDPVFDFYKSKSWSDWAYEIKNKGFTAINLVIVWNIPDIEEQKKIVKSFHDAGLACRIQLFPTTDGYAYENHPEWQQIMLDGSSKHDWRVYLCPNSSDYLQYIENKIQKICKEIPYDAIQLAEPWFEVWGGPYEDNPARGAYACFCHNCTQKFKDISGIEPLWMFDKSNKYYFFKPENKKYYDLWIQFRIDSVNDFSIRCYKAALNSNPNIKRIHMYLSDCRVHLDKGREFQAMDLEEIVTKINPDMLTIQDAWQDWTQPNLKPDFILDYGKAYVKRIKRLNPSIKLQSHLDIGSRKETKRDYQFMRHFSTYTQRAGFQSPSYYEYSIQKFHEKE